MTKIEPITPAFSFSFSSSNSSAKSKAEEGKENHGQLPAYARFFAIVCVA